MSFRGLELCHPKFAERSAWSALLIFFGPGERRGHKQGRATAVEQLALGGHFLRDKKAGAGGDLGLHVHP